MVARNFLIHLILAASYAVHTVLTDNGTEALAAPARGHSVAQATRDALIYTCKHLNLDFDETTSAVPYRG
jgi:hypothetical protein